jgi:translocation and assembly module TamA
LLFAPLIAAAEGISYSVDIEGVENSSTIKTIKSVCQLTVLKKHAPNSINALRYRADADILEILKLMRAEGYYEATVDISIEELYDEIKVHVIIHPGPVYLIETYEIHLYSGEEKKPITCDQINLSTLGISLGKPAFAQTIIDAELTLLQKLSECGYPLASIERQEIIADGETKSLRIEVFVQAGPISRFGTVEVEGQTTVKQRFIEQKITWAPKKTYDSRCVDNTQKLLMDSGLFGSVSITHDEELDQEGLLRMKIHVAESKHKSINIGASYQTFYGPGITFGWENRNIGGMGRKFTFQGDVTRRNHSGIATLIMPDFRKKGQDYIWQAQAVHESITPYSSRSYSLLTRLERSFKKRMRASVSAKAEQLLVTASVDNGNFLLFELPIFFRWSTANSLLNPTKGATFEYRATPSLNVDHAAGFYLYQEIIQTAYQPLTKNQWLVLAEKLTIGSIATNSLGSVPVPKRFFGGSEEDLRGYHYLTVSPLAHHHKPIGGLSAIFLTIETRLRVSETIGLVPFFDLGNVFSHQLPNFKGQWFKSAGIGVRYFSLIGPLRFDIGFPLDRRKKMNDPIYKVLVSIGQMF